MSSAMRGVTWGNGKTMGIRNGVLELTLADDEVVSLEIPRIRINEGEALADALRLLVPTAD